MRCGLACASQTGLYEDILCMGVDLQVSVPTANMEEIIPAARLLSRATALTPSDYERAKSAFLSGMDASSLAAQVRQGGAPAIRQPGVLRSCCTGQPRMLSSLRKVLHRINPEGPAKYHSGAVQSLPAASSVHGSRKGS